MIQDLLRLPLDRDYKIKFDRESVMYVLELDIKKCDIICSGCHQIIIGMPYLCPNLKRFFCHQCLIDEVAYGKNFRHVHMQKIILTHNNPEHYDFPVMIKWKKEKLESTKQSGG